MTTDSHYCGVAGTGTYSPRELKWGPEPWAGWGKHKVVTQGQPGLDVPRFGITDDSIEFY